jgi:hypothetical protein
MLKIAVATRNCKEAWNRFFLRASRARDVQREESQGQVAILNQLCLSQLELPYKMSQVGWLKQQKLPSHRSGGWKSEIGASVWFWGGQPSWPGDDHFL